MLRDWENEVEPPMEEGTVSGVKRRLEKYPGSQEEEML